MSSPPTLAEHFASLRAAAAAGAGAAHARLDTAVQMLLLTLIATLAGRLDHLALAKAAHFMPVFGAASGHPSPAASLPRATLPGTHRRTCALLPRRLRIGRIPTWFAANRGATAIPRRPCACGLWALRPCPARAPPPAAATLIPETTLPPGRANARPYSS